MSHTNEDCFDQGGPSSSSSEIPLMDMQHHDSDTKPRSQETSPLLDPYRVSDVDSIHLPLPALPDEEFNHKIGVASCCLLILNKMIGTGVFSTPSGIYELTGSVGASLVLWLLGGVLAFTGLSVYLEFGLHIPKSGGEKNYLERVYRNPKFLSTVIFGTEIVVTGFSAGNAYAFGKYILYASGLDPSDGMVRFVAVLSVTFAVTLHATAPRVSRTLSNALGVFKVLVLVLIVISGILAATGIIKIDNRPDNFSNLWEVSPASGTSVYAYAIALLRVAYSYKGWENANYVLGHVSNPSKTLPRAGVAAITLVTVLYFCCNLAYFAVIPKDEIAKSGVIVAGTFFKKVYGESLAARLLPFFVSLSNIGNVLAVSYAHGIVNYEVAKDHILPFTSFFTSLKPFGTPAAAFFLHWLITVIVLVLPPAGEVYEIIIDMYTYPGTIINIFVALGLLYLHWNSVAENWTTTAGLYKSPIIVTVVFLLLQVFMTFFPFVPPPQQTGALPYYAVPVLGWLVIVFGVVYWWFWRRTDRPGLLSIKIKQQELAHEEASI